jgi:hypothetical protein
MLSEQIGPILAAGTKGNPRQIKRFLNTLMLRQSSAKARGFGDEVKLPVLAKLMLAERFLPRLFDQIATVAASSPDGTSPDLAALEAAVTEDGAHPAKPAEAGAKPKIAAPAKASATHEPAKPAESGLVAEWLLAPAYQSWAHIAPAIGTLDLRPYLFVAKERKDYFGATSILGQLASVAEQLLGPKFAVQAMEPELRKLAVAEAGQVFEAVRARIFSGDKFDTEPPGAAGLVVLVKAHPALQANLLEFLEALPRNRLGPWACGGWEGVIKEAALGQRYDQLLEVWSKDGSPILKTTAAGVLRTRKQGTAR